jgi:hypothetical protein
VLGLLVGESLCVGGQMCAPAHVASVPPNDGEWYEHRCGSADSRRIA